MLVERIIYGSSLTIVIRHGGFLAVWLKILALCNSDVVSTNCTLTRWVFGAVTVKTQALPGSSGVRRIVIEAPSPVSASDISVSRPHMS